MTKVTQLVLGTVLLGLGPRPLAPLGHHIIWHGCAILGRARPGGPEPQLLRPRVGSGLVGRNTEGIRESAGPVILLGGWRGAAQGERSDCHLDLIEKQPLSWLWAWRHQTLTFVCKRKRERPGLCPAPTRSPCGPGLQVADAPPAASGSAMRPSMPLLGPKTQVQ